MSLHDILTWGAQIIESPLAVAILLFTGNVLLLLWARHSIKRDRYELKLAIVECRRDGVVDANFLRSVLGITHRYRTAMVSAYGGRREVPAEIQSIDKDFTELRHKIHDETNNRVTRFNKIMERLQVTEAELEYDE